MTAFRAHGSSSTPGLRESINAKCGECVDDPKSGFGTRCEQVGACTSRMCPLYPARSLPRKGDTE